VLGKKRSAAATIKLVNTARGTVGMGSTMDEYAYDGDYDATPMDQTGNGSMMMMGQDGLGDGSMMVGQSLDEIVNQNAKAMRRQSLPRQYSSYQTNGDGDNGQVNAMDYARSPAGPMDNFYNTSATMNQSGMMPDHATPAHVQQQHQSGSRRPSRSDLALDTTFADGSQTFHPLMQPNSGYPSSAHPQSGFSMPVDNSYVNSPMGLQMDYSTDPSVGNATPSQAQQMHLYHQQQFNQAMMASPLHQSGSHTPLSARPSMQDPGGGMGSRPSQYSRNSSHSTNAAQPQMSRSHSLQVPSIPTPSQSGHPSPDPAIATPQQYQSPGYSGQMQNVGAASSQEVVPARRAENHSHSNSNRSVPPSAKTYNPNNQGFDWETPKGGWPSTMAGAQPHMNSQYKNAYSSTGFDMLGVLVCLRSCDIPGV